MVDGGVLRSHEGGRVTRLADGIEEQVIPSGPWDVRSLQPWVGGNAIGLVGADVVVRMLPSGC